MANNKEDRQKERHSVHLSQMMSGIGWKILVVHWNAEREKIIAAGKASRTEEKKIQRWAELDGFDKGVLLAEKLLKAAQKQEGAQDLHVED